MILLFVFDSQHILDYLTDLFVKILSQYTD